MNLGGKMHNIESSFPWRCKNAIMYKCNEPVKSMYCRATCKAMSQKKIDTVLRIFMSEIIKQISLKNFNNTSVLVSASRICQKQ